MPSQTTMVQERSSARWSGGRGDASLCLVYHDQDAWNAPAPAEYEQLISDILSFRQELRNEGRLVTADAVQSARTAMKIQPGPTGPLVTDGPFAETKEQLGGFYVIEARDRDDATDITTRILSSRLATIEVWPLKDLAGSQEARLVRGAASR